MTTTDERPSTTVAGVVLAAGRGSRFAESLAKARVDEGDAVDEEFGSLDEPGGPVHKLTARFRGRPLAGWALESALGAGFNRLYVVVGSVDLKPVVSRFAPEAEIIENQDWADGQATSMVAAVERAEADGHRAVVIGLADQPFVPSSAWRSVGAASGSIVTATFGGSRRPPVKLEREVWPDLPQVGDEGARSLFRLRPELVSQLPCTGNPVDLDTVEDFRRWS